VKPWPREPWCLPPEANAEVVWQREAVLAVSTRPADPARPVVCLDETSRPRLADPRPPQPPAPGRPARQDAAYARAGVVNLVLMSEPLVGWRAVRVSDQRTRVDWAHCVQELVEVRYPTAERIVLVLDKLS
jgi:hypothetical protein